MNKKYFSLTLIILVLITVIVSNIQAKADNIPLGNGLVTIHYKKEYASDIDKVDISSGVLILINKSTLKEYKTELENSSYRFNNIPAGEYEIRYTCPKGYKFLTGKVGDMGDYKVSGDVIKIRESRAYSQFYINLTDAPIPVVTTEEVKTIEEIPFQTVRELDTILEKGTEKIAVEGIKGERTITYKVTYTDGAETAREKIKEEITKKPIDQLIKYNPAAVITTEEKVETEKIAFKEKRILNTDLEPGTEKVVQEGVDGEKTITYLITYSDGEETSKEIINEEIILEPVDKITHYNPEAESITREETKTETIAYTTKYENDSSMTRGTRKIKQVGVNGEKTVDYLVILDKEGNEINRTIIKEEIKVNPVDEIVLIGTKELPKTDNTVTPPKTEEPVKQELKIERYYGVNRYETAVNVSKSYFNSSDTVIIASGENYPDALTAVILAKQNNSPILLTMKNQLPEIVKDEISRLNAKKVIIVGGENSVSSESLKQTGLTIERIAGSNRYETAKLVIQAAIEAGDVEGLIIASGKNYPDALAVGSYAARENMPILLVGDSISEETVNWINSIEIQKVLIVGGSNSVSNDIEEALSKTINQVERVAGSDRYKTSAEIAKKFGEDTTTFVLATGNDYPDALSAGPLAYKLNAPILLTDKATLPEIISTTISDGNYNKGILIGGPNSISNAVEEQLK